MSGIKVSLPYVADGYYRIAFDNCSMSNVNLSSISSNIENLAFGSLSTGSLNTLLSGVTAEVDELRAFNLYGDGNVLSSSNKIKSIYLGYASSNTGTKKFSGVGYSSFVENVEIVANSNVRIEIDINLFEYTKLKTLSIKSGSSVEKGKFLKGNDNSTTNNTVLKNIYLTNMLLNEKVNFNKCVNLENLTLNGVGLSDLSILGNLKNLTILNLVNNSISNLNPLLGMIKTDSTIGWNELDLSLNTTLVATTSSGVDNINVIRQLHSAGLKTLDITGDTNITNISKPECQAYIEELQEIFNNTGDTFIYQ